jgi:hypothetical protein
MNNLTEYLNKSINESSVNNNVIDIFIKTYQKQLESFQKETIKDKYAIFSESLDVDGEEVNVVLCGTWIDNSFARKPSVYQIYVRETNKVLYEGRTLSVKNVIDAVEKYLKSL